MNVSFKGYGEKTVTFEADNSVRLGSLVKMCGNGKVTACTTKEPFCGVALGVRGGYADVQLSGYVTLRYSGNMMSVGYKAISAMADGSVQIDSAGRNLLVTDVDDSQMKCGVIL